MAQDQKETAPVFAPAKQATKALFKAAMPKVPKLKELVATPVTKVRKRESLCGC